MQIYDRNVLGRGAFDHAWPPIFYHLLNVNMRYISTELCINDCKRLHSNIITNYNYTNELSNK